MTNTLTLVIKMRLLMDLDISIDHSKKGMVCQDYFFSSASFIAFFFSFRTSQIFQKTTITKATTIKFATISCRGIAGGFRSF